MLIIVDLFSSRATRTTSKTKSAFQVPGTDIETLDASGAIF